MDGVDEAVIDEDDTQQELDSLIAEGVRSYQQLQQEFDAELFSPTPDPDVLGPLIARKNLVRERLASYGVRVRA